MEEMEDYLKLTDKPRVANLAWQMMKDVSRAGYLARRMAVTKGTLITLDLPLTVVKLNLNQIDSKLVHCLVYSTTRLNRATDT